MFDNIIFISGLHRSGTTAFHDWVASDSRVASLSASFAPENEGIFMSRVFDSTSENAAPCRFAISGNITMENESPQPERILSDWLPYVNDPSRDWLVEKSPVHVVQHKYLRRSFPNAYHYCIVRHPLVVAVASDSYKFPWITGREQVLENWLIAMERFREDTFDDSRAGMIYYHELPRLPDSFPLDLTDSVSAISNTDRFYHQAAVDFGRTLDQKTIDRMSSFGFLHYQPWHRR